MVKKKLRKRNVIYNLEKREIWLLGWIKQSSFLTLHKILEKLDSISHELIRFFIKSEGGERTASLNIHHALHNTLSPVETIGFGNVASGGLLVLQGGDKRVATPKCKLKLHRACVKLKTGREYNAEGLNHVSRGLMQYDSDAIYILTSRGSDSKIIIDLFKKDAVLNAPKALRFKIIDSIWRKPIRKS